MPNGAISTLSYRVSGGESNSVDVDASQTTGLQLKQLIAQRSNLLVEGMRILISGKFVKDETTLSDQGVKPNSKLLIMATSAPAATTATTNATTTATTTTTTANEPTKINEVDAMLAEARRVENWTATASELATRDDGGPDQYYFELKDQMGRDVPIPPQDRRALILGMTLQEKARALSKDSNKTKLALELLVQADKEGFSKVAPQFLEVVDNYGLLCLDIAWAYFKLKDPGFLNDAVQRLSTARRCLEKAYGKDLERLIAIKGPDCPERVLYLRLEVLEGVLAYHYGNLPLAERHFEEAERQLRLYKVTYDDLLPLLTMGFGEKESRIALRACGKDVTRASMYIFQKREEDAQKAEREREQRREKREQRKYGKTVNGNFVNLKLLKGITDMGFAQEMVVEALRQTDNDEQRSLNLLITQPELLKPKRGADSVNKAELENLISMGYTKERATTALKSATSVEEAISLLSSGGLMATEGEGEEGAQIENETATTTTMTTTTTDEGTEQDAGEQQEQQEQDAGGDNEGNDQPEEDGEEMSDDTTTTAVDPEEQLRRQQKEREVAEFLEDISPDEEANYDMPLDEEEQAINEYKALILSRSG